MRDGVLADYLLLLDQRGGGLKEANLAAGLYSAWSQITYYFWTYFKLYPECDGTLSFSVPTGQGAVSGPVKRVGDGGGDTVGYVTTAPSALARREGIESGRASCQEGRDREWPS
jgi:hypothetical protein